MHVLTGIDRRQAIADHTMPEEQGQRAKGLRQRLWANRGDVQFEPRFQPVKPMHDALWVSGRAGCHQDQDRTTAIGRARRFS